MDIDIDIDISKYVDNEDGDRMRMKRKRVIGDMRKTITSSGRERLKKCLSTKEVC